MATQTSSSPSDFLQPGWTTLPGKILAGGFELQEILEADEAEAQFKVRVLGDRDLDCVALFFSVSAANAEAQEGLWTLTRQLRHPDVSAPLGNGQLLIDGKNTVYVVVRRADESLDGVLCDRALTVEEAGEVLTSVARALEALHLNGLCYGCLAPSRVMAVGDSIKLPAECVRGLGLEPGVRIFTPAYLAPESANENLTAEADIWCLGATLFEALTQKVWMEDLRAQAATLPEPFASIVLLCLDPNPQERATLGEIMALFRGEVKLTPRVRTAGRFSKEVVEPETGFAETQIAGINGLLPEVGKAVVSPASEADNQLHANSMGMQPAAVDEVAVIQGGSNRLQSEVPAVFPEAAQTHTQTLPGTEETQQHRVDVTKAQVAIPAGPVLSRPKPARPTFDEAIRTEPVARRRASVDELDEPATSLWVWAGLILLVLAGLIWALRPRPTVVKPFAALAVPAANQSVTSFAGAGKDRPANGTAVVGGPGANAWETRTLQPDGTAVRSTPSAGVNRSSGGSDNGALWRVVAFTYSRREDAEKKIRAINTKHGGLHAELFQPAGPAGPFLVALGGRMSRDNAAQARHKAVNAGMPRDSYIQNYDR